MSAKEKPEGSKKHAREQQARAEHPSRHYKNASSFGGPHYPPSDIRTQANGREEAFEILMKILRDHGRKNGATTTKTAIELVEKQKALLLSAPADKGLLPVATQARHTKAGKEKVQARQARAADPSKSNATALDAFQVAAGIGKNLGRLPLDKHKGMMEKVLR